MTFRKAASFAIFGVRALGSDVAAATVKAPTVERFAPNKIAVSWTAGVPVDVLVSDRPDAQPADARLISDNDRDGRHEMTVAPGARVYFILREDGDGDMVRVAERLLPLEHGSNFRDIGGYPAAGGKHVRWGMIYRSGATAMLTDADVRQVNALGLRNMIDLRSNEERVLAPTRLDGIRYSAVGYSLAPALAMASKIDRKQAHGGRDTYGATTYAPQFRLLFATLLAREGPLVLNCSAGQDRTGLATALILSALGVPRDIIYQDYHLSTAYRRPQYEMPPVNPLAHPNEPVAMLFVKMQQNPESAKPRPLFAADGKALLAHAFEDIEQRWGSVDDYLVHELGIDRVKIASLRATYLE